MIPLALFAAAVFLLACLAGSWWLARREAVAGAARPAAPRPVLSLERVRAVRLAAEDAAMQVAMGRLAMPRNPHAAGTREAVLWTTSFNARLMELETEAFAPIPPVPAFMR